MNTIDSYTKLRIANSRIKNSLSFIMVLNKGIKNNISYNLVKDYKITIFNFILYIQYFI